MDQVSMAQSTGSIEVAREILVVENDPRMPQKLEQLLGSTSRIRHATTGLSALEMIENQAFSFDLLITEIQLPDLSGSDVIKKSREIHPQLICMVLTQSEEEDDFFSAIRAGAHGYLIKTDIDQNLICAIDSILSDQYPVSLPFSKYLFKSAGSPITANYNNQFNISPRELQLLKFIAQGHSYADCARLMKISLSTIQTHIRSMYRKMQVTNQRQAIKIAHDFGLLHH
jgi:DNA-binding NarL/FixJ family response regulator